MARKQTVRIEVFMSGTLWDRIREDEIPADDDDQAWKDFSRTFRSIIRDCRRFRDEQEAIREARRTYK